MFYFLNNEDFKSNKKKKLNPYRKVIKQLVNDINNTDYNSVLLVNELHPYFRNTKVENFISWVQEQGDDISYSQTEKMLKEVYTEIGVDKLLTFYISALNTSLTEDYILKLSRANNMKDSDFFDNYEEFKNRKNARTTLTKISLLAIIFSENLLDKNLYKLLLNDEQNQTKIVKDIKLQKLSLLNGINDIPLLLSQKEADLICDLITKLSREEQSIALLEHLRLLLSQHILEKLNTLYCFENKLENFITSLEFTEKEATKIELSRFFPIPLDALHQRKIIPPDNGVVLKLVDHPGIESIYVNECSRLHYRIIYGIVRHKDNHEQPFSLKIDTNPLVILFTLHSNDVVSVLIDFYKISQSFKDTLGIKKSFKFDTLSADTWKYRTKNYTIPSNKCNTTEPVKINTYIRRTKGNPSKETLEYANKLKLSLEQNHTIVKEKDRRYNIFNP